MTGKRTLIVALAALPILVAGIFIACKWPQAGTMVFSAFALAVVGVVASVAGKSSIQTLAQGDGIKGAIANLTTSKKPGE